MQQFRTKGDDFFVRQQDFLGISNDFGRCFWPHMEVVGMKGGDQVGARHRGQLTRIGQTRMSCCIVWHSQKSVANKGV